MAQSTASSRRFYTYFLMILGGLGGLLYGYDLGVIPGALLFMNKEISLTTAETSLIVGAMLGGGAVATLIAGPIADVIGRKTTIIISGVIFLLGMLVLINSHTFMSALFGRLIQGAGIGIEMIVLPLYLAETTPPEVRGRCMTLFQLFLTFGILSAYSINLAFEHSENWRGMFVCVLIPGLIMLVGSLLIPESPRWLFWKNNVDGARESLLKTRSLEAANHDLLEMKNVMTERANTKTENESVWQRHYILPFAIALSIACLNQLTGINSFIQYSTLVFKTAGIDSNFGAMISTVGMGLVNFLVTLIAIFLIDRLGRKLLLMIGTAGTVCVLAFLGVITHNNSPSPVVAHMVVAGLLAYIAFFAIGPGVVVWLALSELIPMRIRSKGMSIALFANSVVSTLLASVFLTVVNKISLHGTFFLFAGFTLIYFAIATFALPETKQKSLEEIEQYFRK
jgi:SP family galactose:H+ symporter-like MFS transporter